MKMTEDIKLMIDSFKKLSGDGKGYYIPLEIQKRWFYSENPNGAIVVSPPQLLNADKQNEYSCTVRVYKNNTNCNENVPNIQVSSKASANEDGIDPYYNSQIKAIRQALKDLGYWCFDTYSTNNESFKTEQQEKCESDSEAFSDIDASSEDEEADLTIKENAMKLKVLYRNYEGRTIADLYNSKDESDKRILEWFATSKIAAEKNPKEALAAKTVLKK